MNEIQHLILDGKKFVVLSEEKYEQLHELEEISADIEIIRKYEAHNPETFPEMTINRIILNKEHPLKVFREYRGFTQQALATKCGINTSTISQIETNKRTGTTKLLSKIAKILKLTIDDITT